MTGTPSRPRESQCGQSDHSSSTSASTLTDRPTPRIGGTSGGVADKLGLKYELVWAINYALRCIQNEHRSLTIEDLDPDLAKGSEFTYINENGETSATQVKRQNNITDHWTIAALRDCGVLAAAAHHVAEKRKFYFNSTTPSGALRDMAVRSRQSDNWQQFRSQLPAKLKPKFDELTAEDVFGTPEKAWRTLRSMHIQLVDEEFLAWMNARLAEVLLEGASGESAAATIGSVLLDNLRIRITRHKLIAFLADYGIKPHNSEALRTAHEQTLAATRRWSGAIERELLSPPINRPEAEALVNLTAANHLVLVVGPGGSGKSSVLFQATRSFEKRDAEVLAFRIDRCGDFNSTLELGKNLGFSTSPVTALQMAAEGREAFLIIDQLDTFSLASGRYSERYDVIAELIEEAKLLGGIHVILACRLFDVENDHRINKFASQEDVKRLEIKPLSDEAVVTAVSTMGLNSDLLTDSQRELLRSPLNLILLKTISGESSALNFTSQGSLFEAYWQQKQQTVEARRPGTLFNDVLARIADAISDSQSLSASIEILDPGDFIKHARVLASEQIIVIEKNRVSFFHEMFFDYTFARQWLSRQQTMIEFLCAQEQDLFRRAQVRQILELLRERDPDRFRAEVEDVLDSTKVRFHIKWIVIAVLTNVNDPTDEDVELVLRLAESESSLTKQLWIQLARRHTWFRLFHAHGHITRWLDSNDTALRDRSVRWMSNVSAEHYDEVAAILTERSNSPDYATWLLKVTRNTEIHRCQQLFELLLDAIRSGKIAPTDELLWLSTSELAEYQPLWAIELLKACFVESPTSLRLDSNGRVALLDMHGYGTIHMIKAVSRAEPQAFSEVFLPHLLTVMEKTHSDSFEQNLRFDPHFSWRFPTEQEYNDIGRTLYNGVADALGQWAQKSPDTLTPILQLLTVDEHDAAQALLYHALIAGAASYSSRAAELMLRGGNRLKAGYLSEPHWLSREVVEAIAPIISDEVHLQLEEKFRDLPATYKSSDLHCRLQRFGYTAFTFLSALDPARLTPLGYRRLQEYQRKFGQELPNPPTGIISYTVGSPIDAPATGKMSNAQWLRAMAKYNNDDHDIGSEVGGARELAQQLQARTAEDPARFAGLAMQFTPETNPAYSSAILCGFGQASDQKEIRHAVFDAVRHIMSLGLDECDLWLGQMIHTFHDEVPLDIVNMLLDRALHAPDPVDDSSFFFQKNNNQLGPNLFQHGINTTRGSLAQSLGVLLSHDPDGMRTNLVAPHLIELASDPVLSVRTCVADTIAACLRHARQTAYEAFRHLIKADDLLLASDRVKRLMIFIGNSDPKVVDPIIIRMLDSADCEVQTAGGYMAGFAALEWGCPVLMERALSYNAAVRCGVAKVCATRVNRSADSELVVSTLNQLMHDDDDEVRKQISSLARSLRGESLRPYAQLLTNLIASPSYAHTAPQLLITLQEAPDKVDDLIDLASDRFLSVHGEDVTDLPIDASLEANYILDLAVRGLTQTRNKKRITALLNILDRLLELGAYGVNRAIDEVARK